MGEMLIRQSLITERLRPRNFTDELSGCANLYILSNGRFAAC